LWSNSTALVVGARGSGVLEIVDGGVVTCSTGIIGESANSNGSVLIEGAGSKWTAPDGLVVGQEGPGTLTIRSGGIVEAAKVEIGPQGQLFGKGLVMASVANHGKIAPGESIGAITIDGNYAQIGGVLEMEVSGPGDGQADQLVVTGDITFGGTLKMNFIDGYAPRAGDVIEFLSIGVLLNWGNTAALGGASVPEPSAWALALAGFLMVALMRLRRFGWHGGHRRATIVV
jgi:T5SS/PEP-CTERM-associated repeat protein